MDKIKDYCKEQNSSFEEKKDSYKITANFLYNEDNIEVVIKIEDSGEGTYCVKLDKKSGNKMFFWEIFKEIEDILTIE